MPTKPRVRVNGLPDLRFKANGAGKLSPKYRCAKCHIKIPVVTGLCDDCDKGAPYITWADRMGADRFFLMCRPEMSGWADTPAGSERNTYLRAWRQTPNGKAHTARRSQMRAAKGKWKWTKH